MAANSFATAQNLFPHGGWYSMPRNYVDGGLIIGDSGSFLDSQRLKGIHMAIKSGMLAAETIFEALKAGDTSAKTLSAFPKKVEASYIKKELWARPQFPSIIQVRPLRRPLPHRPAIHHRRPRPHRSDARRSRLQALSPHRRPSPRPPRFKGDGKLTFDRLTDVYHSGTRHEEDQPCHLIVHDLNVCATKCTVEYGNPCQYFCPAAVYETVTEAGNFKLKINAANCVHCKTCDIADPYQIIDWVVPEGGGGPNYEGM